MAQSRPRRRPSPRSRAVPRRGLDTRGARTARARLGGRRRGGGRTDSAPAENFAPNEGRKERPPRLARPPQLGATPVTNRPRRAVMGGHGPAPGPGSVVASAGRKAAVKARQPAQLPRRAAWRRHNFGSLPTAGIGGRSSRLKRLALAHAGTSARAAHAFPTASRQALHTASGLASPAGALDNIYYTRVHGAYTPPHNKRGAFMRRRRWTCER